MTGYESKRAAARDKLEDDDTQIYQTELTKLLMESYDRGVADALEETKKALAQPAQEPVAWLCKADENGMFGLPTADKACKDCFPVYRQLPQRPWVGLTNDDIFAAVKDLYGTAESAFMGRIDDIATAQAIEARLKEKNS